MLELLEVEVCWCGLVFELEGWLIEGVVIRVLKLCYVILFELFELLLGCFIFVVCWCGKYLLIDCWKVDVEGCLIIYFGMFGNLCFVFYDLLIVKYDYFDLVLVN